MRNEMGFIFLLVGLWFISPVVACLFFMINKNNARDGGNTQTLLPPPSGDDEPPSIEPPDILLESGGFSIHMPHMYFHLYLKYVLPIYYLYI